MKILFCQIKYLENIPNQPHTVLSIDLVLSQSLILLDLFSITQATERIMQAHVLQ